jgi:hypothetical protein
MGAYREGMSQFEQFARHKSSNSSSSTQAGLCTQTSTTSTPYGLDLNAYNPCNRWETINHTLAACLSLQECSNAGYCRVPRSCAGPHPAACGPEAQTFLQLVMQSLGSSSVLHDSRHSADTAPGSVPAPAELVALVWGACGGIEAQS